MVAVALAHGWAVPAAAAPARPQLVPLLKETWPVHPGGTLNVELIRGTLEIATTDRDEATLEVIPSGDDAAVSAQRVRFTSEGDVVKLRQSGGEPATWRYRVTVPTKFNLDLRDLEGRIYVTNIQGSVKAWTATRSIHIGKVLGDVNAESASGGIAVQGATGNARVKSAGARLLLGEIGGEAQAQTAGGPIKVLIARGPLRAITAGGSIIIGAAFSSVEAQTAGGSIAVALLGQPLRDSTFTTAGGSIEIKMLSTLAFHLEGSAQNGRVESDLPVQWQGDAKAHPRVGQLNNGGPKLMAKTSAGRVWFEGLKNVDLPEAATRFEFPKDVLPERVAVAKAPGGDKNANAKSGPKPEEGPFLPVGLLMRDGQNIQAEILGADETQVVFRRPGEKEESVLTTRVAVVLLRPLPEKRRAELNQPVSGLLLTGGDFMEGECREFKNGRVTVSSVLYGLKKFETKRDARALVFHPLSALKN